MIADVFQAMFDSNGDIRRVADTVYQGSNESEVSKPTGVIRRHVGREMGERAENQLVKQEV